jgi:hypothetical protein
MVRPALVRTMLRVMVAVLTAFTFAAAYLVDNRFLLQLLPPSLTYFMLDAIKDARYQKTLQAALDAKREARTAAEREQDERDAKAGSKEAKQEGVNYKKTKRAKAA